MVSNIGNKFVSFAKVFTDKLVEMYGEDITIDEMSFKFNDDSELETVVHFTHMGSSFELNFIDEEVN